MEPDGAVDGAGTGPVECSPHGYRRIAGFPGFDGRLGSSGGIGHAGRVRGGLARPAIWLAAGLSIIALGINIRLAWIHLKCGGAAGWGSRGCEAVIGSRWSDLFGRVPVEVCGSAVWLALVVCLLLNSRRWALALAGVVAGAAFWFVFVQAVILGAFCVWCMAAHVIGIFVSGILLCCGVSRRHRAAAWVFFGKWVWAAILVVGICQVFSALAEARRIAGPRAGMWSGVRFAGGADHSGDCGDSPPGASVAMRAAGLV